MQGQPLHQRIGRGWVASAPPRNDTPRTAFVYSYGLGGGNSGIIGLSGIIFSSPILNVPLVR